MLEEKQIVQNYSLICEISIIILICNKKPNCLRVMTAIKNATKLRQNKSFFLIFVCRQFPLSFQALTWLEN